MKKLIILLLLLFINSSAYAGSYIDKQLKETKKNTQYNTVKIHKRNYQKVNIPKIKPANIKDLKDPKLIKLSDYTPVNAKDYEAKIAKDEAVYKTKIWPILNKKTNSVNIDPASVDFYNIYRISERLIRANNLQYVNWRIAIRKTQDVNASSFNGNYILINTALYDSLYTSEEALAFTLAHEMSHLILGHGLRQEYLGLELTQLHKNYKRAKTNSEKIAIYIRMRSIYNEMKMMEYMADSEALIILTRAGYSPYKALEALNFLESISMMEYYLEAHPATVKRIQSAKENIYYANPDWANEGKANIYNSEVLTVKKSSDRVSIIINKSKKLDKFYEPETITQRCTRLAYVSYLNGNMEKAVKYFDKLRKLSNDYIPYLYISYAEEYLYKQTKEKKHLKYSIKAIEKAERIKPNDENIAKQMNELKLKKSSL